MDFWPWDLLTPRRDYWRLRGVTINGGVTVEGASPVARTDGGGLWVGEQEILIHGRDAVKAVRAIEACLDAGIGKMVVWSYEEPFAPGYPTLPDVSFDDGSSFSDGALHAPASAAAMATEAAAKRATVMTISMIVGALQGGENFSITHPTKGVRRYRIMRVAGDVITFRPPLREAVNAGDILSFERVGCVCKLANPDDFLDGLDAQRGREIMVAKAMWVEAF